jgi:hypothetical protein
MEVSTMAFQKLGGPAWAASELEATHLRGREWVVRPVGQLGTIGFAPRPWSALFVVANTAADACQIAAEETENCDAAR